MCTGDEISRSDNMQKSLKDVRISPQGLIHAVSDWSFTNYVDFRLRSDSAHPSKYY